MDPDPRHFDPKDLDLRRLLEVPGGDTGPSLARVRARQQRRRTARLKVAALSCVVVLGAGLGVGLSQAGGPRPSATAVLPSSATPRPALLPQAPVHFRHGAVAVPGGLQPAANGRSASTSVTGLTGGFCSFTGCSGGVPQRVPVSAKSLGRYHLTALVATDRRRPGVIQPMAGAGGSGFGAEPRLCGVERELSIVLTRSGRLDSIAVLPLPVQVGPAQIDEAAETLFRPSGSSRDLLVATALVAADVGRVEASIGGAGLLSERPHRNLVVLAGFVPARASGEGVRLRAFSSSGRLLLSLRVPGPSQIGLVNGACLQPAG